jgi:hypothetical protein
MDDPPMWQGAPSRAAIIAQLTATRIYAKGGQVPPFRWNATIDDPPMWQGAPARAAAIPLLTAVIFYGQGGQTLSKWWRFYQDEPSSWSPTTVLNGVLVRTHAPVVPANALTARVTVSQYRSRTVPSQVASKTRVS